MKKSKNLSTYHWDSATVHTPNILKDLNKILSKPEFKKFNHLDVGCGNGFITKKISKFFKKTTGIDLSKDGINFAKKSSHLSNNIKFLNIDSETLVSKKKKYDFITSIEVIEHQYDPFKFLKNIEKLSKKKALILITTPYHGYVKNLVLSILGLMDNHFTALWLHGHIKFFSIKTLKKLISNYKFEIINISFSGRIYPLSSSMIFLLKKK